MAFIEALTVTEAKNQLFDEAIILIGSADVPWSVRLQYARWFRNAIRLKDRELAEATEQWLKS